MDKAVRIRNRAWEAYNEGIQLLGTPIVARMGHPIYEKGAGVVEARVDELLAELGRQRELALGLGELQREELLGYIDPRVDTLREIYQRSKRTGEILRGAGLKLPFAGIGDLSYADLDDGE
mgnify:FL=1